MVCFSLAVNPWPTCTTNWGFFVVDSSAFPDKRRLQLDIQIEMDAHRESMDLCLEHGQQHLDEVHTFRSEDLSCDEPSAFGDSRGRKISGWNSEEEAATFAQHLASFHLATMWHRHVEILLMHIVESWNLRHYRHELLQPNASEFLELKIPGAAGYTRSTNNPTIRGDGFGFWIIGLDNLQPKTENTWGFHIYWQHFPKHKTSASKLQIQTKHLPCSNACCSCCADQGEGWNVWRKQYGLHGKVSAKCFNEDVCMYLDVLYTDWIDVLDKMIWVSAQPTKPFSLATVDNSCEGLLRCAPSKIDFQWFVCIPGGTIYTEIYHTSIWVASWQRVHLIHLSPRDVVERRVRGPMFTMVELVWKSECQTADWHMLLNSTLGLYPIAIRTQFMGFRELLENAVIIQYHAISLIANLSSPNSALERTEHSLYLYAFNRFHHVCQFCLVHIHIWFWSNILCFFMSESLVSLLEFRWIKLLRHSHFTDDSSNCLPSWQTLKESERYCKWCWCPLNLRPAGSFLCWSRSSFA